MNFIKKYLKSLIIDNKSIKTYCRQILIRIAKIDYIYKNLDKLSPVTPLTINTPETKDMVFISKAKTLQKDCYSLPPIYTVTINKAIFSAKYNIVLTRSRKVISESINTQKERLRFGIRDLYFRKIEKISGFCSILRSTDNNYYHTLIDNIPRLYLIFQPEYQKISEIKLLISSPLNKAESFFLNKLLPDNIQPTLVDPSKLYVVEHMIFPTFMTQRFAGYLPPKYIEFFQKKVLPARPRNKKNRIFIVRKITDSRSILNENEVFEILKLYGFQKYSLENMSIEEQIELFYDADCLIAAHGAGLSNIIFSENIKILELFPTSFVVPFYYYLAKSLDHTYTYWCGTDTDRNANFEVDISRLSNYLEYWIS